MKALFSRFDEIFPELVEFRRDLHMYPELSHKEVDTPVKIAAFLENIGLDVRTGVGGRGVVGTLKGGKPGKTIALRADFDALPIQDEKDVPYKSKVPGVMHACGHDIHTASLLGVAKVLSEIKENLAGTIVFIHQFAEEVIPGGAKFMIEDGCLDGVDVVYGAHVSSQTPLGKVNLKSGDAMANGDMFKIEVNGSGGHAASPHLTIDPLLIGSQILLNLQPIVSRNVNPIDPAVISITTFQGGEGYNVIPERAILKGTVRTFSEETRDLIEEKIGKIAKSTGEAAGATIDYTYTRGYPAVRNHPEEVERVENIATDLFGAEKVSHMRPQMGMEDFAYYVKEVPGTFFWVGGKLEDETKVFPHHHARFDVQEEAMKSIGQLFIGIVLNQGS